MVDLLKQIIDVLPEAQKIAIKSLIDRKKKTGEAASLRSQQQQAELIFSRISSSLGSKVLKPRYASSGSKISSFDHNKNMEEIYIDLNALYLNIDSISKQGSAQGITLNSEYEKSKAAIHKLLNDVSVFSLRKKYPEFNDVKVIDFNVSSNQTKRSPSAEISSKTRLLQLKPITFTRAHLTDRGTRHTKVYTKTYARGIKGALAKTFTPDLMVDQRPETFWGTLVMSDMPISQEFDIATSNSSSTRIGVDGPVTEIYLQFSHIELVNTVRLLPFSEFPLQIIDVAYRSSPSSQIFTQIQDFYPSSTLDWEELNFESVYAHEIKITVAQSNYKKVSYHLPKHLTINTDLFQQIFNKRTTDAIDNGLVPDSDALLSVLSSISSYAAASQLLQDILVASGADSIQYPETKFYDDAVKVINEVYSTLDPSITSKLINPGDLYTEQQTELIEINKYEYILGMREVEVGYTLYSPTAYYESAKYSSQATISEIAIEVDERHTEFETPWESDYRKTSVEWEIDLGDGRRIPIHPRNIVDEIDSIPSVKDERIYFEQSQNFALTRLGGYYSEVYRLKKDGNLVPSTEYSVTKITGSTPRLKIQLTGSWNDNSIYTVDYAVDPDSYNVQVLDKFNSVPIPSPEVFNSLGSDNELSLSKYPFINYEVVNLTGYFSKDGQDNSWVFYPPQRDVSSGQLRITPTIFDDVGNMLQTGSLTGFTISGLWGEHSGEAPLLLAGNAGLSSSYFGSINGVSFGYYTKVQDSYNLAEVSQFLTSTGFLLANPFEATLDQLQRWDAYSTGVVFVGTLTGSNISGYLQVDYKLGIGVKTDDQVFALSENRYTPILVKVGGVVAKNITDYETLQHPSFSMSNSRDNEYQYIHAGRKLYFNQPIKGQEIRVEYNWVTDYVSLLGTLRCNKMFNPDVTPKINNVRILINNFVI